MPATSSSFVISTSVYLLSSTLFLGIAYSPVQGSFRGAEMKVVRDVAEDLVLQFDSLSPGAVIPLSWKHTILQVPVSVTLAGQSVSVSFMDIVMAMRTRSVLPSVVLDPSKVYLASLEGDKVTIESKGFG